MIPTRRDFLKRTGLLTVGGLTGLGSLRCTPDPVEQAVTAATDFAAFDGVGLAELVRNGEVTPLELVEDVLRRVDAVNPRINAVLPSLFDPDKARARAMGALGDGPLSGVPVMLKNLTGYAEAAIDSGSRLFSRALADGKIPPRPTSPLVQAMEDTGMIITGITSTPELGLTDTTEPVLHGPTRNPWNPEYSPGGSSGGTGAAIAAGIVPLAHGNDGGGSIRLPACQNGIFGLKPSRGRELGAAEPTVLSIANNLCLSRSVRDTAAFLSVTENRDNPDLAPVGYVEGPSSERLRIALMTESFHGEPMHDEVRQAVESAAELCRELGHEVAEVPLPVDGKEFMDTFIGFWSTSTLDLVETADRLYPDTDVSELLEAWTLGLAELARERGVESAVARAEDVFARANEAMIRLFESHDVMLSPVARTPPFRVGEHDPQGDFDTILERVLSVVAYTPLQNATGMPGMSVPLHWTADGLPVGLQFSAWRGGEARLLALAYELEEARPWFDRRPPIHASSVL
ncbi:MAG: amidase family protein [Thermoanaerobaculia bacterium]|nr:amidase family protein [Thermoanaerobaculia bacterium]